MVVVVGSTLMRSACAVREAKEEQQTTHTHIHSMHMRCTTGPPDRNGIGLRKGEDDAHWRTRSYTVVTPSNVADRKTARPANSSRADGARSV